MEGNCVRRAESVRCWLRFVFTPGRLVIVLGWCLWTYGVRVWDIFLWVSFLSVLRSVVEDKHSLMGGSGDAFASWPGVYFYPFWVIFCLFPDLESVGFLDQPLGACPRG